MTGFFVFFAFLLTSYTGLASDNSPCPRDGRPLNFIVLVHGLAANGTTFGHMDEALTKHLSQSNPQNNYCVAKFVYPTGAYGYDLYSFAKMLGEFVSKKVGAADPQDQISLIAHSEGGLVSLLWLQHLFRDEVDYHSEYRPNVAKLITLSTPFWGTGATVIGEYVMKHTLAHRLLKVNFGAKELQDLSFGSQGIWSLFRKFADPTKAKGVLELSQQMKILNIGGYIPMREDDLFVPLASSRLGAIIARDLREDYDEGDILPLSQFSESYLAPQFIPVMAGHAIRLEKISHLPSIANVKEDCVADENCSHPSYKYILDFLNGRVVTPKLSDLEHQIRLRDFLFELNVLFPTGDIIDPQKITMNITKIENTTIRIGGKELTNSAPFRFTKTVKDPNPKYVEYRVETKGRVETMGPSQFRLDVSSPGFKSRTVLVPVKGGRTTMLEIRLAPR